jgi:hypothetical protein
MLLCSLLLLPAAALPEDAPKAPPAERVAKAAEPAGEKRISGMSILGNQEAPKALVIVPWKSSEMADTLALESMLDDSRRPVDKDVFGRELAYYEISSK